MIKKGFTLSEVLVTLGIIGVIAAMAAPAIMNLKPDDVKMKFVKSYSTLTNLTSEILGDNSYYWTEGYDGNGAPVCRGLNCRSSNGVEQYNMLAAAHPELNLPSQNDWVLQGLSSRKLALILASKMNLQSGPNCNGDTCNFTTTDGVLWNVTYTANRHNITVDVDTSNNNSLTFQNVVNAGNMNRVKDIDTFSMEINNNTGRVKIADSDLLGQEFIKNPTQIKRNIKEREDAYKKAKKASDNANE